MIVDCDAQYNKTNILVFAIEEFNATAQHC